MSPLRKLSVWYWRQRQKIGRYLPDPVSGVGFGPKQGELMSSGELGLLLDVEGRTGTVYLSKEMRLQLGSLAGWAGPDCEMEAEFGSCRHGTIFTTARDCGAWGKVHDVFLRRKDGTTKELLTGAPTWMHAYNYACGFLTGAVRDEG